MKVYDTKLKIKIAIRIFIGIVSVVGIFFLAKELISNVDSITKFAQSSGVFGPIILILLIALGILFSPIPSVLFIITAGYLYGTWTGAIYSYLGHLIAATSVFAFFKSFEIKNEGKRYRKYKELVEKNRKILYIMYAVPILPISLTTIISASSKTGWRKFLEIITISFIPAILFFSFFGNRISSRNLLEIGILTLIIIIVGIVVMKMIKNSKKRTMNGYPSRLKGIIPKRKHKYVKINHDLEHDKEESK